MLNELYEYLMLQFDNVEKASVAIYELQTFLIEVAVYPKEYYEGMRFDQFFNWLITTIKSEPKLWFKNSPMH